MGKGAHVWWRLVGWVVGWLDGEVVWEMWPVLGRDRKYCWWIGSLDSRSENVMIGFDLAELQSSRCCSCDSFPFAFYKKRLIPSFVSWKSYMFLYHHSQFFSQPHRHCCWYWYHLSQVVKPLGCFSPKCEYIRRGLDQMCIPTIQILLASSYMLSPDF